MIERHWLAAALTGLLAFLGVLGVAAEQAPIRVLGAWIREAPPVAIMLAGYVTLENITSEPVVIIGGSSPSFARVEIHLSVIDGGVAHMVRQDRVEVPAGSAVAFEPGGYHLMLMKPQRPLAQGDVVEIRLELERGGSIAVTVPVRKAALD